MNKKFFKKLFKMYIGFIIPTIFAYFLWVVSGKKVQWNEYVLAIPNISMVKIFINNTIICLLMIVSGKYFKVLSTIIFFYNSIIFSYYFLISLTQYGSVFVFEKLIYYAPFEIFAIAYSMVISQNIDNMDTKNVCLNIVVVEIFLFIASYLEMLVI